MSVANNRQSATISDSWSEELKAVTRAIIRSSSDGTAPNDLLLKKDGQAFGLIRSADLASGLIVVRSPDGELQTAYADSEGLIHAGWVVD